MPERFFHPVELAVASSSLRERILRPSAPAARFDLHAAADHRLRHSPTYDSESYLPCKN
ncbi:hypothetical protein PLANPX_5431 [Lacipirellula parvula]|uniref:Uncharacterized protein n=1 Tax=Lacipirellula parvula TaxID=2650471 RepID=A0A5K7XQD9_9BACT|nr:hypothetical protein PLANPX_5431 [Lacipirellula parvula]